MVVTIKSFMHIGIVFILFSAFLFPSDCLQSQQAPSILLTATQETPENSLFVPSMCPLHRSFREDCDFTFRIPLTKTPLRLSSPSLQLDSSFHHSRTLEFDKRSPSLRLLERKSSP